MSPAEILQQRARALARPPESTDDAPSRRQVLRFSCAGTAYAVVLDAVRRVVPLAGSARLPAAAAPLVGLVPVDGELVGVLGLSRHARPSSAAWAVAVETGSSRLALPADEVVGVAEVAPEDLAAASEAASTGASSAGSTGTMTSEGDLLLDVAALLSTTRPPTDAPRGRRSEDPRTETP